MNTTFVSLLPSCALHRIEPRAYLGGLFCLLPGWPRRRVLDLAPTSWTQTSRQQDPRERLSANPFRLALPALDRHPDAQT